MLLILACVLPFVASCKLDYSEPPYLDLSTNSIEIGAEGGETSFRIFSNYSWTITPSSPQIKVSPVSGPARQIGTVTVTVPPNTTGNEIQYGLSINTEVTKENQFIKITLIVTQSGVPAN